MPSGLTDPNGEWNRAKSVLRVGVLLPVEGPSGKSDDKGKRPIAAQEARASKFRSSSGIRKRGIGLVRIVGTLK